MADRGPRFRWLAQPNDDSADTGRHDAVPQPSASTDAAARSRWLGLAEDAPRAPDDPAPARDPDPGTWLLDQPPPSRDRPGAVEPATSSWLPEPGSEAVGPDGTPAGENRATAVDVYCAELCAPSEAAAASAEVLGSSLGTDEDLIRSTRIIAAEHTVVDPPSPRGRRGALSAERTAECASTPSLLAARANGELPGADSRAIERHLNCCLPCQALELRAHRAERAFAAIVGAGGAGTAAASAWLPSELETTGSEATTSEEHALPAESRIDALPGTRSRLAAAGAAVAIVVAAVVAVILLTSGSTSTHRPAPSHLATARPPVTKASPVRRRATERTARPHKRSAAVHRAPRHTTPASPAAATPPADTSAPPIASRPVARPPASASPAPSKPSSAPTGSSAPAQPTASFQQPSLGASNASQGLGSKPK